MSTPEIQWAREATLAALGTYYVNSQGRMMARREDNHELQSVMVKLLEARAVEAEHMRAYVYPQYLHVIVERAAELRRMAQEVRDGK